MMLKKLRQLGILGINQRNVRLTTHLNPRRLYPLVDDKLRTKALCIKAQIPVPKLLAKAEHHFEIRPMLKAVEQHQEFVIKPARGAMGNGILVITGRRSDLFLRTGGRELTLDQLIYHASGIISGLYALGGHADVAFIEERLHPHLALQEISFEGVPDIRTIVYRGFPIMAMMRLPTRESGGRANLHQGAIGVGIDLSSGTTIGAVHRNKAITRHPDTGQTLLGRTIPFFDRVLEIATRVTDQTGLGYVGADIVIDAELGPVILELNARPGLAIQLCNRSGLLPRIRAVEEHQAFQDPPEARIGWVQQVAQSWLKAAISLI